MIYTNTPPDMMGDSSHTELMYPAERQQLNLNHSPVALYEFNGDLTDSSTTGTDLVVDAGTPYYGAELFREQESLYLNGGTKLRGDGNSALKMTGDMTAIVVFRQRAGTGDQFLFEHANAGTAEADNVLYRLYLKDGQPVYLHQSGGSGTSQWHWFSGYTVPIGETIMFSFVRSASQIQFYFFGAKYKAQSAGLLAPTGGTNGKLWVGSDSYGNNYFTGDIMTLKIVPSALTQADIIAEARRLKLPR